MENNVNKLLNDQLKSISVAIQKITKTLHQSKVYQGKQKKYFETKYFMGGGRNKRRSVQDTKVALGRVVQY